MSKYVIIRGDEVFVVIKSKVMPLGAFKRNCIIKYGCGLKFKELK